MDREPRLLATRYFEYRCGTNTTSVHDYFKDRKASTWCIQDYIEYLIETETELDFIQNYNLFIDNLTLLNQLISTPVSIRSFCSDYLAWLKSDSGLAITEVCCKVFSNIFEAKVVHRHSSILHDTVEELVCLSVKTDAFQAHLKSGSGSSATLGTPRIPPQTFRDLTSLLDTPNKRPYEKEELQQYIKNISIVCTFGKSAKDLSEEIGEELATELLTVRDANPEVWTPVLENYIDAVLEGNEETFRDKAQDKALDTGDKLFRLYCEKVLIDFYHLVDVNPTMSRRIGERKHIVYQVSSLFKFYERTFTLIEFDWIESHAHAAKIMKSSSNSGIVRVDIKGMRISDGFDIFHMEVTGPPCNATEKHTIDDAKKTMRTDILNLITVLRNHLDCNINLATKIRVYSIQSINGRLTLYALSMLSDGRFLVTELATAVMPFSFNGRSQYKAVLRMMSILHDEITKQEKLMKDINRLVLRPKETTVRHVLKIPELE